MNLDVSPDGEDIVFDMLGDIFTVPVEGGEAKLLRGGHAFEVQPRFSPGGEYISFTSDAGGGDNIWIMNRDGTHKQQLTWFHTPHHPLYSNKLVAVAADLVWSPDGSQLACIYGEEDWSEGIVFDPEGGEPERLEENDLPWHWLPSSWPQWSRQQSTR